MKNHLCLLMLGLTFAACNSSLHGIFNKKTPHEQYAGKLEDKGLEKTPAGQAWLAASRLALEQPVAIKLPYQQQGFFPTDRARALGLQFHAHRGERLSFSLATANGQHLPLYADLFREDATAPEQIHAADTAVTDFGVDVEENGNYILRLQPQLYQGGYYQLAVSIGPSMGFPVSGTKTEAGSFWGDDRDGGKRRHEGVDLFAPKRTPVVAATDGYITGLHEGGLGGKVVWLRPDGRDYTLYYAHLDEQLVKEGQQVKKGEVLGLVGNTGNAKYTASHLHFGVYTSAGAIDPYPFINPVRQTGTPAPHRDLTAGIRINGPKGAKSTKNEGPVLIPLAVSAQGYIAELPTGQIVLVPLASVQVVHEKVSPKA